MKNIFKYCLISLLALITGCGGGGGSTIVPNYAGAWSGGVSLISNTCARQIPEQFKYISLLHNVEQGLSEDSLGNSILDIVLNDGIDTYVGVGEVDSNGQGHSFSATGSPHELPGFIASYKCIETIDFEYSSIDFTNNTAGYVTRHSSITCTKGSSVQTCDVTYTGSSYRTSAA